MGHSCADPGRSQEKLMVYNKLITRVNPHLYRLGCQDDKAGDCDVIANSCQKSSTAMSCWAENFES